MAIRPVQREAQLKMDKGAPRNKIGMGITVVVLALLGFMVLSFASSWKRSDEALRAKKRELSLIVAESCGKSASCDGCAAAIMKGSGGRWAKGLFDDGKVRIDFAQISRPGIGPETVSIVAEVGCDASGAVGEVRIEEVAPSL